MYRLSLYDPWSTDKPLWEEVLSDNDSTVDNMHIEPLGYFAAANLPDENTFLIHGGQKGGGKRGQLKATVSDTWVYDMYRNEWRKPQLSGTPPAQRFVFLLSIIIIIIMETTNSVWEI